MKKILQEFKQFAMRGNVVDMAVGIIIGGAFGKIVSSIVADLIMPAVGLLVGGVNFTDLKITLKHAVMEGDKVISPAVSINYGNFIQVTLDFIIIAFAVFLLVKGGGGRITGTETGSSGNRDFALYHADQYAAPTQGSYSTVQSVDGSTWYKQYAQDTVEKTPYTSGSGKVAYNESIVQKLPPAPQRKERM